MSHTDYSRPRRAWGYVVPEHADQAPRHQPRPALRRTRTRVEVVRHALREEGRQQ